MWRKRSNFNTVKPEPIDKKSSKTYVYIRKNFTEVPASEGMFIKMPAHWEWLEMKVPKQDWDIFEEILEHDKALDDVYGALTELASLIEGE